MVLTSAEAQSANMRRRAESFIVSTSVSASRQGHACATPTSRCRAAQSKAQGRANLIHPPGAEPRHPPSQSPLRNGHRVVKIYRAAALHAIVFVEHDLRWHSANGGCYRGDGGGGQVPDGALASEDQHWTLFIRSVELVKPYVTSGYFSGHAASDSQS